MNDQWKSLIITEIRAAVYVAPNSGRHIHKNRPYHGIVLNDANGVKEYHFDDGRVMRTEGNAIFYLPKGSSYYVKVIRPCGCYAINFDAEISDEPFCVTFRNTDSLLHNFRAACDAHKSGNDNFALLSMRALYDGIYETRCEFEREYVSVAHRALIEPALRKIEKSFAENELSVSALAAICGVSEVYFRRIFLNIFGISPKEYIIEKRIEYAKSLLSSGDFSVSAVAALCGYAEPCHFSREFSRRVGTSPSKYAGMNL